jgi:hypothetical protein
LIGPTKPSAAGIVSAARTAVHDRRLQGFTSVAVVALSPNILDCAVRSARVERKGRGGTVPLNPDLNLFVEAISLIVWAAQHSR